MSCRRCLQVPPAQPKVYLGLIMISKSGSQTIASVLREPYGCDSEKEYNHEKSLYFDRGHLLCIQFGG